MIQDAKMVKDTGNFKKNLNSPISQELLLLHNKVKLFLAYLGWELHILWHFWGRGNHFLGFLVASESPLFFLGGGFVVQTWKTLGGLLQPPYIWKGGGVWFQNSSLENRKRLFAEAILVYPFYMIDTLSTTWALIPSWKNCKTHNSHKRKQVSWKVL